MGHALPTVRIMEPGMPDGLLINASDFDPARHVAWSAAKPQAADSDTPPPKRKAR